MKHKLYICYNYDVTNSTSVIDTSYEYMSLIEIWELSSVIGKS